MRRLVSLGLLFTLAVPGAVLAGKKDKKKDADVSVTIAFGADIRQSVHGYYVEKHGRGNCPPGLAKKNNGCLPPGQAKKRYSVGRALPPTIVIQELPVELSVRVGVPPAGYRYGIVDGDVVKLAVGTMLVVDAIQGLVE